MTTLNFTNDDDAMTFASELLVAHNESQICYKYERECEIEFWWEYATQRGTDERDDEEDDKQKAVSELFDFLKRECIAYE